MKKTVFLRGENLRMNYVIYEPENTAGLPLLVFLHGAGERGGVVEHLSRHGVPKLIESGSELPAVVLCPQCHESFVWGNLVEEVKAIIDGVASAYKIGRDRICLTGGSMGGFGTWDLAMTYPSFFSAAAPVAGGGLAWRAPNLISTPIWAFHGENDEAVPVLCSSMMTDAVNLSGGHAKLTVLEGFGHNDGINEAYFNTGLIPWLLAQRRTDFSPVPETLSKYF